MYAESFDSWNWWVMYTTCSWKLNKPNSIPAYTIIHHTHSQYCNIVETLYGILWNYYTYIRLQYWVSKSTWSWSKKALQKPRAYSRFLATIATHIKRLRFYWTIISFRHVCTWYGCQWSRKRMEEMITRSNSLKLAQRLLKKYLHILFNDYVHANTNKVYCEAPISVHSMYTSVYIHVHMYLLCHT